MVGVGVGSRRGRRRRLILGLVAALVAIAVAAVVIAARRTPAPPAGWVDVPDDEPVEVVLGLARDQDGLQRYAADGASPVLSIADISSRFGAAPDVRQRLSDRLGAASLTFSATGGLARWQTTLGSATSTLGLRWSIGAQGGERVLEPAGAAAPPEDLRDIVTEVVGLPRVLDPGPGPTSPATRIADLTAAPGCDQARRTGADVVNAQGLDAVHAAGHTGSGARISVIAVTRFDRAAFTAWLRCIGHAQVQVRDIQVRDGGSGSGAAVEAQTDLAALTLALPSLDTVTLVGSDDTDWVGDALETALTDPAGRPQVISTSIVFCERLVSTSERNLTEYVLAAAAAAGVTVVAATGDRGSTACAPDDVAPAVTYPASSPFVLAVGGSNGSHEVWMNTQAQAAGGGGDSQAFPGRRLPDLAMLSSAPDLPPMPVCSSDCEWGSYGGTSFAAPFVAGALVAVGDARSASGLQALRLGIGTVERTVDPTGFVDVTRGSNDLAGVGCCTAAPGFDLASGWGVPRFDVLAGSPAG